MDTIVSLQELALATRLRRLSDRLMRDVSQIYGDLGLDFRARWFPLLHALGQQSPRTVMELAGSLRLSHPAIHQIAGQMIRRRLLEEVKDPHDDRKRLFRLSANGRRLVRRLTPVLDEIRFANRELLLEAKSDLLGGLARVEAALDRRSMEMRVRDRLGLHPQRRVEIVDYRPAYKKHFRALNEAWLKEYFQVEDSDARLLGDPNGKIIKRGGAILFALLDDDVVGTCALMRHPQGVFELTKMAVSESAQGRGIGSALALAAISRAAKCGACEIFLQTSPRLTAAGRLYRRLGFRRVGRSPFPADRYGRCSITMRLDLTKPVRPAPAKEKS
jgi:ribosomal protein S18 acetylase RimI-like enzyme